MKIDENLPIKAICAYPLYNRQVKKNHLFQMIFTRVLGNNNIYIMIQSKQWREKIIIDEEQIFRAIW